MNLQLSSGAVDAMMGYTGLLGAFDADGCEIRLYAGSMPADANAAIGGATLLATIKHGGASLAWHGPTAGVIDRPAADTWSGAAVATGTATFARIVTTADDGSLSTSLVRVQGDVAVIGALVNLDNPAMTSGAVQTINSAMLYMPRS